MKVVRLSALRTGRLHPPGNTAGTHFCYMLSQHQNHSAVGRFLLMKNSSDTIRIKPATFRFVQQCLNQLPHRVPQNLNVWEEIQVKDHNQGNVFSVYVNWFTDECRNYFHFMRRAEVSY
jgi:hypothetical protein